MQDKVVHNAGLALASGACAYGTLLANIYFHEMGHKVAVTTLFNDVNPKIKFNLKLKLDGYYMEWGGPGRELSNVGRLLGCNLSVACVYSAGWVGEALFCIALSNTLALAPRNSAESLAIIFATSFTMLVTKTVASLYSLMFMCMSKEEENKGNDSYAVYKYGGLPVISAMCAFNACVFAYYFKNMVLDSRDCFDYLLSK